MKRPPPPLAARRVRDGDVRDDEELVVVVGRRHDRAVEGALALDAQRRRRFRSQVDDGFALGLLAVAARAAAARARRLAQQDRRALEARVDFAQRDDAREHDLHAKQSAATEKEESDS